MILTISTRCALQCLGGFAVGCFLALPLKAEVGSTSKPLLEKEPRRIETAAKAPRKHGHYREITGTHIAVKVKQGVVRPTSMIPVQVYDSDMIQRSGATSVGQFLTHATAGR